MSGDLRALLAAAVEASTHPVADVHAQPGIHLVDWAIIRNPAGTFHLAGWDVGNAEGRISSAVNGFEIAGDTTWRAVTSSGRIYILHAPGGGALNPDGAYVADKWLQLNCGLALCKDLVLSAEETAKVLNAPAE